MDDTARERQRLAIRYTRERVYREVYAEPYEIKRDRIYEVVPHDRDRIDAAIAELIERGAIEEDSRGALSLTPERIKERAKEMDDAFKKRRRR